MKLLSVVGARPQFVKLAPIAHACDRLGIEHVIVHTGQHYDPMLSDVFFTDLQIPQPDEHLGVGSGSHGKQTGAMLMQLDEILATHSPDWVLVYGDTNSTLAATLSAVKQHIRVAHLEAGLRSFNRQMPEEHNRVLTDHAADLLLAPTKVAADHLSREGLASRTVVVGDIMTDVLLKEISGIDPIYSPLADIHGLQNGSYSLVTIHRAENTDDPERLRNIINSLRKIDHQIVIVAHPRLIAKCEEHNIPLSGAELIIQEPLSYRDLLASLTHSRGVITDSGGLQKEAFLLRKLCTTVRTETEWVETVELEWNLLVDPGEEMISAASRPLPTDTDATPYGDGNTAIRVLKMLESRLEAPQD